MKGKILLVTGLSVGYVLGARAGRARYNQIARLASKFWKSTPVQRQVHNAEEFVKDKGPDVAELAADGARTLVNKVTHKTPASPSTKA